MTMPVEDLKKILMHQFEMVNQEEVEGNTYTTLQFNSLINVAGEGDFRVVFMETPQGDVSIVDYQGGEL